MASRTLKAYIIGDSKGLERALNKAQGKTGTFGKGISKALGVVSKAAIGAGLAIGGALVAATVMGVKALEEQEVVLAKTGAVLKSTGGAAGVTAKQVNDLANSLMEKSGVDDMAIQSGENLLLTFTNIQNKAGEGNDIFNQATGTMLDMSVALGQDMKSSAIQLGKALNDPIKGMTALQRVGVSFTQEQKDQVKAMVEAGDSMGAQKLILAELNREFGGAAEAVGETFQGRLAVLKEKFEDLTISIAEKLMPVAMQIIDWATQQMPKVNAAWESLNKWLQEHREEIKQAINEVWQAVKKIWENMQPVLKAFGNWALKHPTYAAAFFAVAASASTLGSAVGSVHAAFVLLAKHPIVAFIVAIGVALMVAWEWGQKVADSYNGPLRSAMASLGGPVALLSSIVGGLADDWNRVVSAAKAAYDWMRNALGLPAANSAPAHQTSSARAHGATGGIVTRPTFALIGEAGPEAVIPLSSTPGSSALPGGITIENIVINANSEAEGRAAARGFKSELSNLGINVNLLARAT